MFRDSKLLLGNAGPELFCSTQAQQTEVGIGRADLDMLFIKESRFQIATDFVAPMPVPANPETSNVNNVMASKMERLISSVDKAHVTSTFLSSDSLAALSVARKQTNDSSSKQKVSCFIL